jgi:hypothetical protein
MNCSVRASDVCASLCHQNVSVAVACMFIFSHTKWRASNLFYLETKTVCKN